MRKGIVPTVLLLGLVLSPAQGFAQGGVCNAVKRLLEESRNDFRYIRTNRMDLGGGSGESWDSTVKIPGAMKCDGFSGDPESAAFVSCTMRRASSAQSLESDYRRYVSELKSCLTGFDERERIDGTALRVFTIVKTHYFEKSGHGEGPDGPSVKIQITEHHPRRPGRFRGFELDIDVSGMDPD